MVENAGVTCVEHGAPERDSRWALGVALSAAATAYGLYDSGGGICNGYLLFIKDDICEVEAKTREQSIGGGGGL